MDESVFSRRVAALRQILVRESPDTAWIIQPENRRYLSGFRAEDSQLIESSGSLLINDLLCLLITDSRYTSEAEKEVIGFEVHTLKEDLQNEFAKVVHHIGTRELAFEEDYLTWGLHRQLAENLKKSSPPVLLTPLNNVVEQMREVKDDSEIKALETSADLISTILDHTISRLAPGVTEKEVAWQIAGLARDGGAEGLAFPPIVASGPNSALPHAVPTDRKLRKKEPIVLDVGVKYNGYCSDMTRTIFLGKPAPDFKNIYETVREAQLAALRAIRPGEDSDYPDAIARQVIKDAGFGDYFVHSLGHGVGLATHERPRLSPKKPVKLKKRMVVTVEPGIYIPGKGGVRIEEMVVIEDSGPRILTKTPHFGDLIS